MNKPRVAALGTVATIIILGLTILQGQPFLLFLTGASVAIIAIIWLIADEEVERMKHEQRMADAQKMKSILQRIMRDTKGGDDD